MLFINDTTTLFVDGVRSEFLRNASLSSLASFVFNADSAVTHTDYDVSLLYRTTDEIFQLFLAEFEVCQLQPLAIHYEDSLFLYHTIVVAVENSHTHM